MKGWAFWAGAMMVLIGASGAFADTVVGDVDADGKVDLKEAVHALQVAAGMRPEVSVAGAPAAVEKSGQTTSWGAGDDGQLGRGVTWPNPRFTDNGNDTVTDNLTGLMWTKDANIYGRRTWTQALADCEACTVGGHTDWHLPQVKELQSLIHFGYFSPALSNTAGTGQWTSGDPFTNVQSYYYWSATTHGNYFTIAWDVAFDCGYVHNGDKSDPWYVWCVRGGPN